MKEHGHQAKRLRGIAEDSSHSLVVTLLEPGPWRVPLNVSVQVPDHRFDVAQRLSRSAWSRENESMWWKTLVTSWVQRSRSSLRV